MRYHELTETVQVLPRFEDVVTPEMRAAFSSSFDRSVHGPEGYMTADSIDAWVSDRMPDSRNDPNVFDDPKFRTAFDEWLHARYRFVRRKLSRLAVRPTIKAWRVIRVDHDWLQHPRSDLGIYWTYNLRRWNEEIGAYPIWADETTDKMIDILIIAEVPHATVDWLRTFRAHMDYYSGDREFELRLMRGSPVNILWVQDLDTKRPLPIAAHLFTA